MSTFARIGDTDDFIAIVQQHKPGDVLTLKVERDKKEQELKVTLGRRPGGGGRGRDQNSMGSTLSNRRTGFPIVLQHDCVVKPAEDACLSLLRIAELSAEAGFPEGAINVVTGLGNEAGIALARHLGIDHLSFTGSPATGSLVAQEAAKRHCPVPSRQAPE